MVQPSLVLLGDTPIMTCAYCARTATTRIPAYPENVCVAHAVEFWTGLVAYARDRATPCTRFDGPCDCPACEAASESTLRDAAIRGAVTSPGDHEEYSLRRAS